MELRGHSPNFHIHVSVSDLYISTIDLPVLLQELCGPILGIAHGHMNVKIDTETAEIPRKGTHEWDFCCSAPAENCKRGRNYHVLSRTQRHLNRLTLKL
jgi:hypothetical protein